jgi:hypothetical protein
MQQSTKRTNEALIEISGKLLAYQMANSWDKELTKLFKPLLTDRLSAPLTPEILSPEDVHMIIEQHQTFTNTFFREERLQLIPNIKRNSNAGFH